jgi:hypothetical protein
MDRNRKVLAEGFGGRLIESEFEVLYIIGSLRTILVIQTLAFLYIETLAQTATIICETYEHAMQWQ